MAAACPVAMIDMYPRTSAGRANDPVQRGIRDDPAGAFVDERQISNATFNRDEGPGGAFIFRFVKRTRIINTPALTCRGELNSVERRSGTGKGGAEPARRKDLRPGAAAVVSPEKVAILEAEPSLPIVQEEDRSGPGSAGPEFCIRRILRELPRYPVPSTVGRHECGVVAERKSKSVVVEHDRKENSRFTRRQGLGRPMLAPISGVLQDRFP